MPTFTRPGEREEWLAERREANAEARREYLAGLRAQEAEKAARLQAARDAAAEQRMAELKASLRTNWSGTAADFERNWPALRDEYLRREAINQREALLESKRQQLGGKM